MKYKLKTIAQVWIGIGLIAGIAVGLIEQSLVAGILVAIFWPYAILSDIIEALF